MTLSRRNFLASSAALGSSLAVAPRLARGQDDKFDAARSAEYMTPETQKAVDKALTWLAKRQNNSGADEGAFGHGGYQGGVAVGSLAGLAFMCSGSPAGARAVRQDHRQVRQVHHQVRPGKRLHLRPGFGQDNMYGHGFATLFLSEVYGMSDRSDIDATVGDKLRLAVKLTCQAQNDAGGWRYQPVKSDADLSITICNIMGLRAARDAGIHVPDEVRAKCIDYVKKSQNADGSFRYQIAAGGSGTFPLTAAGVVSLYSAGIYDSDRSREGAQVADAVHPRQCPRERRLPRLLLLRPVLRRASHVARRRRLLDQVVSRHPRHPAQKAKRRRQLRRQRSLRRIRHRHGLHHPANAEQLPANLLRRRRFELHCRG